MQFKKFSNLIINLILILIASNTYAVVDGLVTKVQQVVDWLVIIGNTLTLGAIVITAMMFLKGNPNWGRVAYVILGGLTICLAKPIHDWIFSVGL